jgi:hypothetical protein
MNYSDVKNAVTGQDIVYINLAGNLEAMTKNIVQARMKVFTTRESVKYSV